MALLNSAYVGTEHGKWEAQVETWSKVLQTHLHEAGQNPHGTTEATEIRAGWGQEILKWCTKDADTDVYEKMNKYCLADKSW